MFYCESLVFHEAATAETENILGGMPLSTKTEGFPRKSIRHPRNSSAEIQGICSLPHRRGSTRAQRTLGRAAPQDGATGWRHGGYMIRVDCC